MYPARIVRFVTPGVEPENPIFHIDGEVDGSRCRLGRFPSYEAAVIAAETAGLDLLYGWTDEIGINPRTEAL